MANLSSGTTSTSNLRQSGTLLEIFGRPNSIPSLPQFHVQRFMINKNG
jgi:hypothetical protein